MPAVYWEFSLDKHFGEYTLGEILVGKAFMLCLGKWKKALSEDSNQRVVSLMRACHLTMLGMSCLQSRILNFGFTLEARIKREHPADIKVPL